MSESDLKGSISEEEFRILILDILLDKHGMIFDEFEKYPTSSDTENLRYTL